MDVAVSSAENVLHDCPELRPFLLFNARLTGTTIGSGAYGCVEEVAIPGAICAAKKIHNIFHDPAQVPAAAIRKAFNQFVKECQLMSTLRHPNIVQFLGITFFPGSQLPVLVMERLLTSLHDLLEPEVDPLLSASEKQFFPLSLKCSILENVASGLVYLHERSPPVIHRDLSARNVLLNSALVAKIADLGVARIVPRMTVAATMTKAPGAGVYMPPEALEHQPSCERRSKENDQKSKYDASIDVFSYGVVAIFTLCQTFPCNLLAPTYRDKQRKIAGRSELERRESYMSMIRSQLKEGHPLLQMIEGCLDFPEDRPTIHEVLGLLEQARAVIRDKHVDMNKLELVQALHAHSRSQQILEENLYSHVHLLQEKLMKTKVELRKAEEVIGKLQQQNMEGQQLQSSGTWEEQQLRRTRKPHVEVIIQERHLETQGKHCPRKNDAEVATSPRNIRNVRPQKNEETKQLLETGRSYSIQAERQPKELAIQCYSKKPASQEIVRGSATTDGETTYITLNESNSVYGYKWSIEKWEQLPSCVYFNSGLVIISGELAAVGGWDGCHCTRKIFTLRERKWVVDTPPMNVGRSHAAVLKSGDNIIVIGGFDNGRSWTNSVELLQARCRKWVKLTPLPLPLSNPSATMCGNFAHVIGSSGCGCSCFLQIPPPTEKPTVSHLISWTPLPPLPVNDSTATTLCGQLVIFGGKQRGMWVNSICQLLDGKWVEIGSMCSSRSECLLASTSPEKTLVLGGWGAQKFVEECTVIVA